MTELGARQWQGSGASPGIATGPAHVIRDEGDLDSAPASAILIARHATPALFPSLIHAEAAVCETGGLLTHLALLARELGKPCVTGLPGIVGQIEPGARLRVDGTRGMVAALTGARLAVGGDHPPTASATERADGLVPLVQFGAFSATFAYLRFHLDPRTAVRLAALVTLPLALGEEAPWTFAIEGNRLLVEAGPLQTLVDRLVAALEMDTELAARLHSQYQTLATWAGWSAVEAGEPTLAWEALRHYVALNQLTWLASVVKEPFTARYQAWLRTRLVGLPEAEREALILDSLILPGRSYIARGWLDTAEATTAWLAIPRTGQSAVVARARAGQAPGRQRAALQALGGTLTPSEADRMHGSVATLGHLVDLTERKNSTLYRCGAQLFHAPRTQAALQRLLGGMAAGDGMVPAGDGHAAVAPLVDRLWVGGLLMEISPLTAANG